MVFDQSYNAYIELIIAFAIVTRFLVLIQLNVTKRP